MNWNVSVPPDTEGLMVQWNNEWIYRKHTIWPHGVVVSALISHVRDAGFDSRPG